MNFLKLYLSYGLVAEEELEFEILLLLITDPHDLIDGQLRAVLKSDFLEGPKFGAGLDHWSIFWKAGVQWMNYLQDLEVVKFRKIVVIKLVQFLGTMHGESERPKLFETSHELPVVQVLLRSDFKGPEEVLTHILDYGFNHFKG